MEYCVFLLSGPHNIVHALFFLLKILIVEANEYSTKFVKFLLQVQIVEANVVGWSINS